LLVTLFMMGLHSTLFGPIKYSIIQDLLHEDQLLAGNAAIESGTFLAILIGTILGGLSAASASSEFVIAVGLLGVAFFGLVAAYKVPQVPIADASIKLALNPLPQIWHTIKIPMHNRAVFNSILGISWFWFLGAAILSVLPVITSDILHASEHVVTLFLAMFTIGIATGAVLCEKLSFQRLEIGLVPWGSLGMTLFLVDFAIAVFCWQSDFAGAAAPLLSLGEFIHKPHAVRMMVDLFMISVFGGLFTVPLYTLIQERSDRKILSRIIASNNILNALFMVVSSGLLIALYHFKFSMPQIIFIFAGLNLLVSIYIYSIVPEFTLRFLGWVISRLIYRIRVRGITHIPKTGAAVIVSNHISFVDWLIISAAIQRPIRFVMYYKYAKIPLMRYLLKHARVILIAGKNENREIFDRAFDTVASELINGELVCIFPEGGLTPDGNVQTFKKGIEHIVGRTPVPVIPLALSGMWDSIFSRKKQGLASFIPKKIWFHVDVRIGEPIAPSKATATMLEAQVKGLL
ncbi:MAG: 1-acyl-sn-glycerol-3-phosphate acyltransferase, partial [Bdellovibrionales bacterium]